MVFTVKPNLNKIEEKKNFAEFVIEPLPAGYGMTLGNSLRRVLLTSLEGVAITSVKIEGVKHEFSTLPGVKEDIIDLILNIKKIRLHMDSEGKEKVVVTLNKKGPGEVTAGDIECPTGISILNPDQYLTNLSDKKSSLKMECGVEKGKGYLPAEKQENKELGVIPVDGIFTPVLDVDYEVMDTRVGGETNLDKLVLKIVTNGGIEPQEALKKGAEILRDYFDFIISPESLEVAKEEEPLEDNSQKETLIEDLNLPMRVINSLTAAGIQNVGELIEKTEKEISQIKNLGVKSIGEVKKKLSEMELNFKEN